MSDEKKTERSLEDLIRQAGDNALRRMVEERKARNTANAATMPPRRDDLGRLEATLKDQYPLFHKARRLQATWGKTWPII